MIQTSSFIQVITQKIRHGVSSFPESLEELGPCPNAKFFDFRTIITTLLSSCGRIPTTPVDSINSFIGPSSLPSLLDRVSHARLRELRSRCLPYVHASRHIEIPSPRSLEAGALTTRSHRSRFVGAGIHHSGPRNGCTDTGHDAAAPRSSRGRRVASSGADAGEVVHSWNSPSKSDVQTSNQHKALKHTYTATTRLPGRPCLHQAHRQRCSASILLSSVFLQ